MTSYELNVTDADIGRSVLFHPRSGDSPRQGIITGQSKLYVFVLFIGDQHPRAIHRMLLEYVA